jgi:hypothetical protein
MDVQTVDREYQQLEQEAQLVGQTIEAFAAKMQTAGDAGDANAKSWLLDLKGIALQIQQEQLQVQSLLQALHDFAVNTMQQPSEPAGFAAPGTQSSLQSQPQPEQNQGGGMMHRFLGGGFGQAVATGAGMGAGFGLTDSLINSIFD